jgi:hypothetical protein
MRYFNLSLLQPCLLEDTIECTRSQFVSRLTGNGNEAGLARVFVLSVTTPGSDHPPTILLDQLDDYADLHILNYLHLLTESLVFERRNTKIWKCLGLVLQATG